MRTRALSASAFALLLAFVAPSSQAFAADAPAPAPAANPTAAQTIAVLGIDSDEAQDQADALSDALKSRARQAPGWTLMEKSPSLGSLTVQLKCPAKPDATCQQKIADTLKSDRYVWGVMSKAGGGGQVNVELHLFRRGKPDFVIRETYSDSLKDQNDEKLRGLARRLFEELTGTSAGHVVVRAGTGDGEVIVDGSRRVRLENGRATIELASGVHTLEVLPAGSTRRTKQVTVQNGGETVLDIELDAGAGSPQEPSKPFPTRTVVGGTLVVVGTALAVTSVVFGVKWIGLKGDESGLVDQLKAGRSAALADPAKYPQGSVYNGGNPCDYSASSPVQVIGSGKSTKDFCDKNSDATTASALFIGLGVGALVTGGVGAYLLATKSSSESKSAPLPKAGGVKVEPVFGTTNGLALSGTF